MAVGAGCFVVGVVVGAVVVAVVGGVVGRARLVVQKLREKSLKKFSMIEFDIFSHETCVLPHSRPKFVTHTL